MIATFAKMFTSLKNYSFLASSSSFFVLALVESWSSLYELDNDVNISSTSSEKSLSNLGSRAAYFKYSKHSLIRASLLLGLPFIV
jgi:hypothetical protein